MKRANIFLVLIGGLFLAFAIIFLLFPRPEFSELERRELKQFPEFSFSRLIDGSFTADVSSWFSDSQPFRDDFMTLSMAIKKGMALKRGTGDNQFVFHQTGDIGADMVPGGAEDEGPDDTAAADSDRDIPQGDISAADGEESKMSKSGILIVGSGDKVRALMNFGGSPSSGNAYASMVNAYNDALGPGVKVYSMVAPIAMEFYCPEEARKRPGLYKSQLPTIRHIYSSLSPGVHAVNVYSALSEHAHEDIYLRTDHHWAPLGAYYAAREFARVAGVHVPELSEFDENVIRRFVGSMYGYSKDISVKNAPEDFIYYTPRDKSYTSTFTVINVDKDFRMTGESKPFKSSFFKKFKDGSGNAYLTFMGSDFLIVKVETGVGNGRRLAILKDSYGNAIPGYLFGSFEEVHVLDFRYFPHNIVEYCRRNGITDFLFVNNIFNACSSGVASKAKALLTRKGSSFVAPAPKPETPEPEPAVEPQQADAPEEPAVSVRDDDGDGEKVSAESDSLPF
ncbi:MAG: hypothetical protein K2L39_04375 [Muribaculaceae bacterium]|nr:hypothetical protein [Muribaculaceae bacterium]